MTNLSEMAAIKARDLKHSAGGFDVEDFIAKLVTFMGGPDANTGSDDEDDNPDAPLDWEKIGYASLAKSRRVTGVNFMLVSCFCVLDIVIVHEAHGCSMIRLGPLSTEAKQKTAAKRQSHKIKKDPSQNVAPEDVVNSTCPRFDAVVTETAWRDRKDITDQQKKHELDTAFMVTQVRAPYDLVPSCSLNDGTVYNVAEHVTRATCGPRKWRHQLLPFHNQPTLFRTIC